MIIETAKIPADGKVFEGEDPASVMELEKDKFLREKGPVLYHLFAEVVSGRLIVRGAVEVELKMQCSRCADFFSTRLKDSAFLRAYDLTGDQDVVDITPDLREDLLLQIQPFSLCDEGCKGLCPQCGANLNKEPCGCEIRSSGGAWSELDQLDL